MRTAAAVAPGRKQEIMRVWRGVRMAHRQDVGDRWTEISRTQGQGRNPRLPALKGKAQEWSPLGQTGLSWDHSGGRGPGDQRCSGRSEQSEALRLPHPPGGELGSMAAVLTKQERSLSTGISKEGSRPKTEGNSRKVT